MAREVLPTTYAQQVAWLLAQLDPSTSRFSRVLRLQGHVDVEALRTAATALVERHSALRTAVFAAEAEPVQRVHPLGATPPFSLGTIGVGAGASDDEVLRAIDVVPTRELDVESGRAFTATLFALADDDHVLTLDAHACAADAASMDVLVGDFFELYEAAVSGREHRLPPAAAYTEHSERERRLLEEGGFETHVEFWRERLAPGSAPFSIPPDRTDPAGTDLEAATFDIEIPAEVAEAMRALAREARATPYMCWLAVLAVVASRWAGRRVVRIATPIDGRRPSEARVAGCFANVLTLSLDADPVGTFRELLTRTRSATVSSIAHRDVPFQHLVRELAPGPGIAGNPFTNLGYLYVAPEAAPPAPSGLSVRRLEVESSAMPGFDLALELVEGPDGGGVVCRWSRSVARYEDATAREIAAHYARLAERLVERADDELERVSMLGEAEEELLADGWNRTRGPAAAGRLDELVAATAARIPDRPAVECRGETLTYAELEGRVNRLAHVLQRHGVGPGSIVGICLPRSIDLVVAMLGVAHAGGAYLPLDHRNPEQRLAAMARDAGAVALVTTSQLAQLAPAGAATVLLDVPLDDDLPETPPATPATADNLAYLIYTSGSTGRPKGVAVNHREAVNVLSWVSETFGVGEHDRLLFTTSPSFDLSVYDVFGVLMAGGCVVVATDEQLADPDALLAAVYDDRITVWDSAPAALHRLMLLDDAVDRAPSSQLRLVMLSGDWVPLALPDRVRRAFPGTRLAALGGATEAVIWSNWFEVGEVAPEWASIPYGRPIRNARYYVLDDSLQLVPARVEGDLYIGGDVLARGYHGSPALTAERFLPDPFSPKPGARMYRTGDRARRFRSGELEFLGRRDGQVKIRGYRVEVAEVEAALSRHGAVADSVVAIRGPATDRQLVAYVVPERPPLDVRELRDALAQQLPDYMLPSAFVELAELPRTSNGKYDRTRLPEPSAVAAPTEGPDDVERAVREIWKSILEVPDVRSSDNFFEVGGHSLRAVQAVVRVRKHFDIELGVGTLLEHPTLDGFARAVEELLPAAEAPVAAPPPPEPEPVPVRSRPRTAPQAGRLADARGILVTGATGFVGIHVLRELLDSTTAPLRCLVRAESEEAARARLEDQLEWYFGRDAAAQSRDRVAALAGDVAAPELASSEESRRLLAECDHVIHSAADVRAIVRDEDLFRANVEGTRNVLALAQANGAVMHHLSTLGINGTVGEGEAVLAEDDLDIGQVIDDPYARTKFAAERVVREHVAAGGTATVSRLGNAAPHSLTGRFQRNIDDHVFARFVRSIVELGLAPYSPDRYFGLIPVDLMASAIVAFAGDPECDNRTLHVGASHALSYVELIELLQAFGYAIRFVEADTLPRIAMKLAEDPAQEEAVGRLLSVFGEDVELSRRVHLDSRASEAWLRARSLEVEPPTTAWFERFVAHCIEVGYLPQPRYPLALTGMPEILGPARSGTPVGEESLVPG